MFSYNRKMAKTNKPKSKKDKSVDTESNGRNPDGTFKKGNQFGSHDNRQYSIVEQFKKKIQEVPKGKKKSYLELWIDRWIHLAIVEGDWQALREGIRYIDGMPVSRTELTGADGGAIETKELSKDERSGLRQLIKQATGS